MLQLLPSGGPVTLRMATPSPSRCFFHCVMRVLEAHDAGRPCGFLGVAKLFNVLYYITGLSGFCLPSASAPVSSSRIVFVGRPLFIPGWS